MFIALLSHHLSKRDGLLPQWMWTGYKSRYWAQYTYAAFGKKDYSFVDIHWLQPWELANERGKKRGIASE